MAIPNEGYFSKKALLFWFILVAAWTRILYRLLFDPQGFEPQHLYYAKWIVPLAGIGLTIWVVLFLRAVAEGDKGSQG